jgi:hypothetical protein
VRSLWIAVAGSAGALNGYQPEGVVSRHCTRRVPLGNARGQRLGVLRVGSGPLRDGGVRASVVVTDLCHHATASREAWAGSTAGTVAPLAMIITFPTPCMVSQVPSTRSASSAARVSCPGAQEKHGRSLILDTPIAQGRGSTSVPGGRRRGRFALGVVMRHGRGGPSAQASRDLEQMPRACGASSRQRETTACPGVALYVWPRPVADAGFWFWSATRFAGVRRRTALRVLIDPARTNWWRR